MTTQKKSKKLLHRAPVTCNSQEAILEYFQSQAECHQVRRYPEWDLAKSGPQIELLKSRRELALADNELEAKLIQYVDKRKYMKQQWTEIQRKEALLRESLIKFNKFVTESREKRQRAQRKIDEEKKRQEKYRKEIMVLGENLNYITGIRDKMQKYVKEYKQAQNYLEHVVHETGEFKSITDILNRYDSLLEARQTLSEHQDKSLKALEEIGINTRRMTEAKGHKLMTLNNQLATFQSRYDRAKAEALKWENFVSRIKAIAAEKNLENTQIKSACWSMYQQTCKRRGISVEVSKDDIENQLVYIKRTMMELKRIEIIAKTEADNPAQN